MIQPFQKHTCRFVSTFLNALQLIIFFVYATTHIQADELQPEKLQPTIPDLSKRINYPQDFFINYSSAVNCLKYLTPKILLASSLRSLRFGSPD